jgi:DNA-binding NtrC family response regulator
VQQGLDELIAFFEISPASVHAEASRDLANEQLSEIRGREAEHWGIEGFIGRSPTLDRILVDVRRLQQVGTAGILVTGESGTGKELVAGAIHFGGLRATGPFVPVNCSAIPVELAESTLFGHVRGAFTGAVSDRKGAFEAAEGGTLFLDEIGDMPPEAQGKLLRVPEDRRIQPVGSAQEQQLDVRIVAATHQDLHQLMETVQFWQDLYFRLAGFTVDLPPLRKRRDDIPLLSAHFLRITTAEMGMSQPLLTGEALAALQGYHFPGNVRELKNIMDHALIRSSGGDILPEHLDLHPDDVGEGSVPSYTQTHRRDRGQDETTILNHLRHAPNITNAECRSLLGVDRNRASYLLSTLCAVGPCGTGRRPPVGSLRARARRWVPW